MLLFPGVEGEELGWCLSASRWGSWTHKRLPFLWKAQKQKHKSASPDYLDASIFVFLAVSSLRGGRTQATSGWGFFGGVWTSELSRSRCSCLEWTRSWVNEQTWTEQCPAVPVGGFCEWQGNWWRAGLTSSGARPFILLNPVMWHLPNGPVSPGAHHPRVRGESKPWSNSCSPFIVSFELWRLDSPVLLGYRVAVGLSLQIWGMHAGQPDHLWCLCCKRSFPAEKRQLLSVAHTWRAEDSNVAGK